MAKNFNLQDKEKSCIFVTKDKRQAIILTISYISRYMKFSFVQEVFYG